MCTYLRSVQHGDTLGFDLLLLLTDTLKTFVVNEQR